MNNFLLSYSLAGSTFKYEHFQAFIASNRYIAEWAYLFPGSYFLKSLSDLSQIRDSVAQFVDPCHFVIVEIGRGPNKTNGSLQGELWKWLGNDSAQPLNALLPFIQRSE